MSATRLILALAAGFAIGAAFAWQGHRAPLGSLVEKHPPSNRTVSSQGESLPSAHADAGSAEVLFSRVLSALQGGTWLKKREELSEALDGLTREVLEELVERAARLPQTESDLLLGPLFERWCELDPTTATAWLRAHPGAKFTSAWTTWARMLPKEALASVHAQPGALYSGEILRAAVKALCGSNRPAQAELLAALAPDSARDQLLRETIEAWAGNDSAAALAFALKFPDAGMQRKLADGALRKLLEIDPTAAAKSVAEYLPTITGTPHAARLAVETSSALAGVDPQAAFEWLHQQAPSEQTLAAYISAASVWVKKDPIAALEWCQANGVEIRRTLGAGPGLYPRNSVLAEAMQADPIKTLQWIQGLPEGDEQVATIETALASPAKLMSSPANDAAVAELVARLPPEAQENATYQAVRLAGRTKLEAISGLLDDLPSDAARAAGIEAMIRNNVRATHATLETILSNFPEGYQRDAAIRGFAATQPFPDSAATALQIADPGVRHVVLDGMMSDLVQRSPTVAQDWLEKNSGRIPAEWKEQWTKQAANRR